MSRPFAVGLKIDPDKANLAGVTNLDVAGASLTAMNGYRVSTLREGDEQIPVLARMRMAERARLSDVENLYVFSSQTSAKVPLQLVSRIDYGLSTEKLQQHRHTTLRASAVFQLGTLAEQHRRHERFVRHADELGDAEVHRTE